MTLLRKANYSIGLSADGLYYVYNTRTHKVERVCDNEIDAIEAVYDLIEG